MDQLARTAPSLPQIVTEVQKEVDSLYSSPATLEPLLEKDTALTARLLKLANSSLYGFASKIDTVSQALTMVGLAQLRDLLMGSAVAKAFRGISPDLVDMASFWRHSVACGICARQLATRRGERNAERFFVAGIMHDIGRLVLLQNLPDKVKLSLEMVAKERMPITDAETKVLNFNHADMGANILKLWRLPENLGEVIRMHHHPIPTSKYFIDASILHFSDVLVDTMGLGGSGEGIESMTLPESVMQTGLFSDMDNLLAILMEEVEVMQEDVVKEFLAEDAHPAPAKT